MARQVVFKQTSGNKSEHRRCANKFNKSRKQTDQAIKQIKQTNRPSNRTDQAHKQIKQTSKSSKQADHANKENRKGKQFTLLLASRPDKKKSNGEAETKRASNTGPIKSNKENEAIEQIKQTNKIDKRQRFLLFARRFVQRSFLLKRNASSVASKNS